MTAASLGAECFAESAQLEESVFSISKDAAVSKPTYQVKGTPGVRRIALTSTTVGATIYYTTDGSVPTTRSKKYTKRLKTTKDVKIRAIAVKGGVSSAVMTKTFKVKTLLGDVTGDGNINKNDYTKLKNYFNKKTTYICKDNADCNGSGGLSTKDLTVLEQYLAGKISKLPSNPVTTVKTPTRSVSSIYGGKSVTLSCATSGATIYYTTNGATPTTSNGKKYTSAFTVTSSTTVKAIAYKNGDTSSVKTFDVTVNALGEVKSDKATNTTYKSAISVGLSCSNSTQIIYTTDGSNPVTSNSAKIYYSPISISKDTTLRVYARAKGYADSDVYTFNYKVDGGFSISGMVWDDTPINTNIANGIKDSGEPGINGIKVYLINSTTNSTLKTTTTASNGTYSFTDIQPGYNYKIVFEYNGQLYRAFSSAVSNGNQALSSAPVALTIRNGGAYNNSGSLITSINSYASAKTNSVFLDAATSVNNYSTSADNVNLALISKNYGILDLTMTVTNSRSNASVVYPGDTVSYLITLTNNAPVTSPSSATATLSDAEITFYMTDVLDTYKINQRTKTLETLASPINGGFQKIIWSGFVDNNGGLAPGKSLSIGVEGVIKATADDKTQIKSYAEVTSYKFSSSCYDYYSVPGNLTPTMTRTLEHDEAAGTTMTISNNGSGGETVKKDMKINGEKTVECGKSTIFYINIENATGTEAIQIIPNGSADTISYTQTKSDSTTYKLTVTGLTTGSSALTVQLVDGNTIVKAENINITVTAANNGDGLHG